MMNTEWKYYTADFKFMYRKTNNIVTKSITLVCSTYTYLLHTYRYIIYKLKNIKYLHFKSNKMLNHKNST